MPSSRAYRGLLRRVLGAAISIALLAPSGALADSILLHWTAPGDNGSVGRASQYDLRYSTNPIVGTDTLTWWNSAIIAGPLTAPLTAGSGEAFTVAGLDSATTYYFVIRAADEVPNWAGYSNVSVRTTGAGGTLVTPTGFTAQIVSSGVRLNWNVVTSGSPAGYHVYRRTVPSPVGALVVTAPVSQSSWTDSSVVAGTTYEYSIATYSGSSESSPAVATITTPGGPPVATTEMVGYPNPAKGRVTFRFHAGTADGTPGRVRLVVYDLTGHKVCKLIDEVVPAGEKSIDWLCMSDAGNAVAPGLYNAILDSPMGRKVTRLAIVP